MQHDRTAEEKTLGGFPTLNKQGRRLEPVILAYGIILEQKIIQQTSKYESTSSENQPFSKEIMSLLHDICHHINLSFKLMVND